MHDLIFSNFEMHITLSDDERGYLASKLEHRTVKKNEALLNSGEVCRNIYFVNKGCLRVYNTDAEGLQHTILFCPENWWCVDITSFSGQSAAFYTLQALEDTEVFYLPYPILEQLYTDIPKLERFFRILTQNGFNLYQRRMTSNLSKTAEERYALFQKLYPKLEQRITQKQIASYLGITPVFLSMIRKRNAS